MLHPVFDMVFTLLTPKRLTPKPFPYRFIALGSVAKPAAAQEIVSDAHTAAFGSCKNVIQRVAGLAAVGAAIIPFV